jgi:hypothetical protein
MELRDVPAVCRGADGFEYCDSCRGCLPGTGESAEVSPAKERRRQEICHLLARQADTAAGIRRREGGPEKWTGYMVKRGFEQVADVRLGREYMWIEVTGTTCGRLVGRLANRPALATYLARGDVVEFDPEEVVGAEWPVGR